jgi:branched-chain amino acid transport system permease protein
MSEQLANVISGSLILGCVYALVGVGFVLLYRATRVLSFAQGAFMTVGALLMVNLVTSTGLSIVPALLIVVAVLSALGALTYRVVFARVTASDPFITSVASLGLAGILTTAIDLIWGSSIRTIPAQFGSTTLRIGNFHLSATQLAILGGTVVLVIALAAMLRWSALGRQMHAVADSSLLALHVGINSVRVATITWALAAASAGLAGCAYALNVDAVDPGTLPNIGLLAFPAIILGGLTSVVGALVGGIALGLIQSIVLTEIGGQYQDVISYGILLLVLLVRPQGLFGQPETVRV